MFNFVLSYSNKKFPCDHISSGSSPMMTRLATSRCVQYYRSFHWTALMKQGDCVCDAACHTDVLRPQYLSNQRTIGLRSTFVTVKKTFFNMHNSRYCLACWLLRYVLKCPNRIIVFKESWGRDEKKYIYLCVHAIFINWYLSHWLWMTISQNTAIENYLMHTSMHTSMHVQ